MIWYLARGAGIAAFAVFSLATSAGAYSARRSSSIDRRVVVQYVHRSAALTGLVLITLHGGMILADSYARVGVVGAFVPFTSAYRPLSIALGTIAMYLLVAVVVSGMLRSRFARSERAVRTWRKIHLASYVAWAASAVHFFTAGTDSRQWWALLVLFAGIAVVAAGIAARLTDRSVLVRPVSVTPQSARDLIGADR